MSHPVTLTVIALIVAGSTQAQSSFTELKARIGYDLRKADGSTVSVSHLKDKPVVVLLFSSGSCSPCEELAKQLVPVYKKHGGGKTFEVILVSSDKSESAMYRHMKGCGMPWLAAPFQEGQDYAPELRKAYTGSESGIPRVILIDRYDNVLLRNDAFVKGRVLTNKQFLGALVREIGRDR